MRGRLTIAVVLAAVVLMLAAGCQYTDMFKREIEIRMVQVAKDNSAYAANTQILKFYITNGGRPVVGENIVYRVLPEETGRAKSQTEITDANGLDMVLLYLTRPVTTAPASVIIEARYGDFTKQFTVALQPYVTRRGSELTFDQSRNLLDAAEANIYAARVALDLKNYYDCLSFLTAAETYLDYLWQVVDAEREATARRDIARYRELVRAAAYPREAPASAPTELDSVFFETGKWDILPQFTAALEEVGVYLRDNPAVRLRLTGHTDNVPIDIGNKLLSLRRAQAVKEYLMQHYTITTERLVVVGAGEERPRADNATAEGRALNRRIEYEILAR